jgi:hypothetical protein
MQFPKSIVPAGATSPTAQPPAKIAKKKSEQFINILKTDHHYDIVSEIVKHMGEIRRAKKIKPTEKHRLLQNYHLTLLSYCLPRIKIQETIGDDTGKGVTFNINIGGEDPLKTAGAGTINKSKTRGVRVSIPTQKNKDGSYSVTASETDE